MNDHPTASGALPSSLRFIHPWRPYQARVLEELEAHLSDDRLHVVAAPGAGKTILGLEVLRRINRPTLILAPTLTVRNQWRERFADQFDCPAQTHRTMMGHDLTTPSFITLSTYQALHAALNRAGQQDDVLTSLRTLGVLVLDEAHHLRREWWRALKALTDTLPNAKVLSLTATPPYDVSRTEWNRYFEMCGPMDAEISVPELVAAGNLCPHQDFVHLSLPGEEETQVLRAHREGIADVIARLTDSPTMSRAILGHPWFANFDDEKHREDVLTEPRLLSAMVVYLHQAGYACEPQRAFLGVAERPVPPLDHDWFEILLTHFLFVDTDRYDTEPSFPTTVRRELAQAHAVERRRVTLGTSDQLVRRLRASDGKLESILAIYDVEARSLGEALRMVVLVDHVRREFLERGDDVPPGKRLGAVPIFERLRLAAPGRPIALLTGSLVVLPRNTWDEFAESIGKRANRALRRLPHPSDYDYVLLHVNDALRNHAVAAVTALFNRGTLRAIVGTVALLGEGWDSAAANTLVLASHVATQVQTNQMRGRVIRIDPERPEKASNIWHLACAVPDSVDGGPDFATLRRRFSTFEGLSYSGQRIESGFERITTPAGWDPHTVAVANQIAFSLAKDCTRLAEHWGTALQGQRASRRHGLVHELRAEATQLPSMQAYRSPYPGLRFRLAGVLAVVVGASMLAPAFAGTFALGASALALGTSAGAVAAGACGLLGSARDAWWAWRRGVAPHLMGTIGEVVLHTLSALGELDRPIAELRVRTNAEGSETQCALEGGTLHDANRFLTCLEEVLEPVDNPRYLLITRRASWGAVFSRSLVGPGVAYAVPALLGTKERGEMLAATWRGTFGPCDLVYTRTGAGRRHLLEARAQTWSLSRRRTRRVSRWQ